MGQCKEELSLLGGHHFEVGDINVDATDGNLNLYRKYAIERHNADLIAG
ncbi:MAG TPA: hypothetical protein VFX43_08460 [Chitinophagaceae bacterium]|nr:hypothetical protein [Chitinophagaceae bacterium]